MKTICTHHSCTGCGLCAALCPVSCITMKAGRLGHLYPAVDGKKCTDCGLCKKKCPALNPVERHVPQRAFAAWSKDEPDYRSSTSGGASSVLAQFIIRQGGVVYGCAVSPGAVVEHIRIDREEDLYRIKGSKYVQSSIVRALPRIRKDVLEKRTVLFLGTPCQTAAVGRLFAAVPDNLYRVDLVCHGTPSQKALHDRLKRQVPLGDIDTIRFRDENRYVIRAYSDRQLVFASEDRNKDDYLTAFSKGYSLRESCLHCVYATSGRGSDITIGDFWGLGKEAPCDGIPEHRYGISLVLPNTEKGEDLFRKVSDAMHVYERPVSEAVNGNDRLRFPKGESAGTRIYRFLQPILGSRGACRTARGLVKLRSLFSR